MSDPGPAGRLVGLETAAPTVVEQAREVYEAGFPAALRAPFADLLAVRTDERTQVLLDDTDTVLGLVLVRDLGDTSWTFLRYFVVAEGRRGQGIGSRLWEALCGDLAGREREVLLFDVEDPDDRAAGPHEAQERSRRVEFYRRLGADLLDVRSYAPPHHGQQGTEPIPLRLMAATIEETGRSVPPGWPAEGIAKAVSTVLRHRYGLTA